MGERVRSGSGKDVAPRGQVLIVVREGGAVVRNQDPDTFTRWMSAPGELLAHHRTGDVVRIDVAHSPTGTPVVRKTYRYPTARDRRRGLFRNTWVARSRVHREALNLIGLTTRGLNPDLFVAYAERRRCGVLHESFLVTHHLPAPSLDQALRQALDRGEPRRRRRLLNTLGSYVARLHDAGFVDRDLHLRNFLVLDDDHLAKIDCPRGAFLPGVLHRLAVRRDLRDLAGDLAAHDARAAGRVLHHYVRARGTITRDWCRAAARCRTGTWPAPH